VTTCNDFELHLTLRATGDLAPEEAARLELHLAACEACRAEAERDAAVLRAVRLPPLSDAERRATAGLARETLAELHRREGRAASWKRAAAAFAAAAAVLVAVTAPALLGKRPDYPPAGAVAGDQAAVSAAAWEEPDLDSVWSDTAILDEEATVTSADASDAALASLDL
jgi:anti-sigma factor RsiW